MKPDVFTRLRAELSLWYAGVFCALLIALGLVIYGHMAQALTEDADALNRRSVTELSESFDVRGGRLTVRAQAFAEEADEARDLFNATMIAVYDRDGKLLASRGDATAFPAAHGPKQEDLRTDAGAWRLLRHRVGDPARPVGTLLIGHDMRDRQAALASLARDLSLLIPVGALLTLLAGTLLAGRALRPIREALERQRRFIADASHELRTPVAIVGAQAEAGRAGDEAAAREALAVVQRTAERMGGLVAGLLLLTRADADVLAMDRVRFYLDELAEEVVGDLGAIARGKAALRFERRAADVTVLGDPELMRQLLTNLVDNALAHTPASGEVVVWIDRPRTEATVLGVRDTGPGIAPADHARVFERFYRVLPAGRPGTGLGLAIVKAIADAHGGTVTVTSEPGQGAEFRLTMPAGEA